MSAVAPLNPPAVMGARHGQQYSDWAYSDPAGILTAAMRHLAGVDFDTFVCRGLSGILVAPLLARAMSRNFIIVRKPNEKSHSSSALEGTFGHKWIFVDDFISSGETFRVCREAIARNVIGPHLLVGSYEYQQHAYETGRTTAATNGKFSEWGGS